MFGRGWRREWLRERREWLSERDDLRVFVRETLLRYDRGLAAMREENERYFEAVRLHQEEDRKRLEEILAEGRAGREALFRMLDKFDGKGGPAAA